MNRLADYYYYLCVILSRGQLLQTTAKYSCNRSGCRSVTMDNIRSFGEFVLIFSYKVEPHFLWQFSPWILTLLYCAHLANLVWSVRLVSIVTRKIMRLPKKTSKKKRKPVYRSCFTFNTFNVHCYYTVIWLNIISTMIYNDTYETNKLHSQQWEQKLHDTLHLFLSNARTLFIYVLHMHLGKYCLKRMRFNEWVIYAYYSRVSN